MEIYLSYVYFNGEVPEKEEAAGFMMKRQVHFILKAYGKV
jgi:hypothetical protein